MDHAIELPHKQKYLLVGAALLAALMLSVLNAFTPPLFFLAGLAFIALAVLIFRSPLFGIAIVGFLLPFERIGAYELGRTTVRLSQVFLIVTIAAFLAYVVRKRDRFIGSNPLLIALLLFIAANVLSLVNTVNLTRSVFVLIFTAFTVVLAWLVPAIVKTQRSIRTIILVLLASCFLVSAFGIFQFFGDMVGLPTSITGLRDLYTKDVLGFPRVQSTAYEPLYFANYLLLPLSLAFALFLSKRQQLKSSWLLIILILGTASFVLTVSRGGYIAFTVSMLVICIAYFRKVFRLRNIVIFVAATTFLWWFVVKALGFGGGLFTLDTFKEHVGNVFYGASFNERVYTLEQAQTAFREHPLVGIGVGAFGPYVAPHPYYMPKDGWKIVNNEFVEILAETGLLGFLTFFLVVLVLIVRSIKAILRSRDPYLKAIMVALFAAFIGVLVQYQTFSTLYIMHVWFLIGLMVAAQNIILEGATLRVSPSHASPSSPEMKA